MKKLRSYNNYEEYIAHQKVKTTDPVRRKKWLSQEWELKLHGFTKIFTNLEKPLEHDSKALCIGARTGQEVVALRQMGVETTGIDIVPHDDLVIEGDMHNLDFEDCVFDFVFSNVFDHSLYPDKKISEIERVLKIGGRCLLQFQTDVNPDAYSENEVTTFEHDVYTLFNHSRIVYSRRIKRNFAGMNWEICVEKDNTISSFYEKVDNVFNIEVPKNYKNIWNEINLPIQTWKGQQHNLQKQYLDKCLDSLQKRAYYLTRIADFASSKNIVEVGTAQGWQFYSFAEYASKIGGHVWSCDIKDVRNDTYKNKYKNTSNFYLGDSKNLATEVAKSGQKIDLFYIDGAHDYGSVVRDVVNLRNLQSDNPIWIFDDFDERFGCYEDIKRLINKHKSFVYKVGDTASGKPNHQVVIFGRL